MKKNLTVHVNGVDFYCEKSGSGPTIVLVPDGCNDCGPFGKLMECLSDEYTVISFDMRGGSRSPDPNPEAVTPSRLADDVAGIIRKLALGPVAAAYGCSSGGQTVLALGKRYPELCSCILPHEAALQADTPLPDAGFIFFDNNETFRPLMEDGKVQPEEIWGVGNRAGAEAVTPEILKRMEKNREFWLQHYRGKVDMDRYMAEDFEKMPPVEFTVGTWTPAWLVFANIETAKRGNCPLNWLHCAHHPELTCPEELAVHIKAAAKKYARQSNQHLQEVNDDRTN